MEGSHSQDRNAGDLTQSTPVLLVRRCYVRDLPPTDVLIPVYSALAEHDTPLFQLLASFVCYELARRGIDDYQQLFEQRYDSDVIRSWLDAIPTIDAWVDGLPALHRRWQEFITAAGHMDPRFGGDPELDADLDGVMVVAADDSHDDAHRQNDDGHGHAHGVVRRKSNDPTAEIALVWDESWVVEGDNEANTGEQDIGTRGADDPLLAKQFHAAVQQFLGAIPGSIQYTGTAGFRLRHRRDVRRLEAFIATLEPMKAGVARAAGYACLALLFYGTHVRSTNLFGRINARKQTLLRDGLRAFCTSGPQLWTVLGVLSEPHAEEGAYAKIIDVLHDFVCWQISVPPAVRSDLNAYDPVGRLLHRQKVLRGERRLGQR